MASTIQHKPRGGAGAGEEAVMVYPSELVGTARVCELLGVDKATVFRRIQAGTLPALAQLDGPGGAWVFHLPDVLASMGQPL